MDTNRKSTGGEPGPDPHAHESNSPSVPPPRLKAPSVAQVAEWLRLFILPGQVTEARFLGVIDNQKYPSFTVSGFFDHAHLDAMAQEVARWSPLAEGSYFVFNPVDPELLSVANNRVKRKPKGAAEDGHVLRRVRLVVDADPKRISVTTGGPLPPHIPSTDAERALAFARLAMVVRWLIEQGWPDPLLCDSGNGFHAWWVIDLPRDDGGLVEAVLKALDAQFSDDRVTIDPALFNPARIIKIYGSQARKGEDLPGRPHRFACVLTRPGSEVVVSEELLKAVAAKAPADKAPADKGTTTRKATPTAAEAAPSKANTRRATGSNGHESTWVGVTVADDYASRTDWATILTPHRWALDAELAGGECRWTRPGKGGGTSASTGHDGHDVLKVFSSNASPFTTEGGYSKFQVFALLNHDGDESAAAKALYRAGYGTRQPPRGDQRATNGDGADPTAKAKPSATGRRPVIEITHEAHAVIDRAVDALAADPDVYQRGGSLVRVVRDPIRDRRFSRPPDTPRIAIIPCPTLLEKLSRFATWVKGRTNRTGDPILVPALPPDWAVSGVAARADWPRIRPLESIIEAPTLRPDGSVLDAPGYDEWTSLLYLPNAEFAAIPDHPTRDDARRAAAILLGLVTDFPFAEVIDASGKTDGGASHRAAWLAAVLTVLLRFAVDGPVPLIVFDASTPGAGKTLLAELVALIAFGRALARTPYSEDDAEQRKMITSVALAGDRLVLIDNVIGAFGGAPLDAAVTATSWRDRRLGCNEMTQLPLSVAWFGTGNNVQFKGDILRRIVHIRLEPKDERPEERDPSKFAIRESLDRHVLRRRPELVAAALTIVRAYHLAGRPDQKLTPVDFRSWSDLIRSTVYWSIGADPCATRKSLVATDEETVARTALVEGWASLPGADDGVTAAQALDLLKSEPTGFVTLRGVVMEWSRTADLPSARIVAKRLTAIKGRVVNGLAIRSRMYNGARFWWVQRVDPGASGASGVSAPLSRARSGAREGEMGSDGGEQRHQSNQSHQTGDDEEVTWSA